MEYGEAIVLFNTDQNLNSPGNISAYSHRGHDSKNSDNQK